MTKAFSKVGHSSFVLCPLSKNLLRRVDPAIFLVLAICLLAVWPFFSRPGLPQETDAELHIFRTAELSHLLRGGAIYPRWAPDFYFGYGYPLFNYYAPLTYYLGAGLMFLPGIDAVLAVKLVFALGLLGAGLGMYAFVGRQWGTRPGVVAAAAYVYAPYIQYVDPHARGDLAEAFSFTLFPWVLWAFSALVASLPPPQSPPQAGMTPARGRWRLPLAAGLLAALICTHNLMALVFTALLVAWLIWRLVARPAPRPASRPLPLVPFLLGIALSAFFWLPVALEQDAVQLGNLVSDGGHFDFRNHFLDVSELLQPTPLLDLGATEPRYVFNLGVAQWVLGLLGALSLFWRRGHTRPRRLAGLFFLLAAVVLVCLTLPISIPIWERVPLMPFLQFPWRLIGPLVACLAVLTGVGVAALETAVGTLPAKHLLFAQENSPRRHGEHRGNKGGEKLRVSVVKSFWLRLVQTGEHWINWATAGLISLILLLAMPLTYPSEWPAEFGPTDPWGIIQSELSGRWLGTTSAGDFVPAEVIIVPRANDQVLESYRAGGPVDRVNRATLPAGTTVTLVDERPLAWTFLIDGDDPFVFRLFHFYFPGWTAILDGAPVPIHPAEPDGFITLEISPGRHQLEIAFQDTPARKAAWGISGIALLLCLLVARPQFPSPQSPISSPRALPHYLLLIPLAFLVFKLALADPLGWFRLRSEGLEVAAIVPGAKRSEAIVPGVKRSGRVEQRVYFEVGDEIALIGYDWQPAAPGRTAELTLYWKALRPVPTNYQVFVHLRDSAGAVVVQSDKLNPGDYPAERWPLDKYVRDSHRFIVPAGIPPGEYRLAVGLWRMAEGERLPVRDAAGNELGDSLFLESLNY